jgi:hypothetical protein
MYLCMCLIVNRPVQKQEHSRLNLSNGEVLSILDFKYIRSLISTESFRPWQLPNACPKYGPLILVELCLRVALFKAAVETGSGVYLLLPVNGRLRRIGVYKNR